MPRALGTGEIGDQPGYVSLEIKVGKPEGEMMLEKMVTGRKEVPSKRERPKDFDFARGHREEKTGAEGDGIKGATSLGRGRE